MDNASKIFSEYVKFYIFCFSWIHPELLVISFFYPFFILYIKLLIDTGTQIDLIKRNIAEKLELKIVEVKIPQHVISCFGGEASEKL